MSTIALLLLLMLLLVMASAFQPSPTKRMRTSCSTLAASKPSDTSSSSLSGLVNDMLKAQREMAKEMPKEKDDSEMPKLGPDGVYQIRNQEQLANFQAVHADQLIVLKFSSPFCQACRMLRERFRLLRNEPTFVQGNAILADITISNNKLYQDDFRDYVTQQLRVTRIPTIQFYQNGQVLEGGGDFGCDPDEGCSWQQIKRDLVGFVQDWLQYDQPLKGNDGTAHGNAHAVEDAGAESAVDTADASSSLSIMSRMREFFGQRFNPI